MEDKFINLRRFWLSKYLIILSIIVFNTSCEKENIHIEKENNTKQVCSFQGYFFIDNIQCYDTLGNRLDSLSYIYSKDDLVFPDKSEYPYEKIEINADSTVIMYYTINGTTKIKNGYVTQRNDTLYFFYNNPHDIINYFLFKGLIVDHQLRLPGFGARYYVFASDGKSSGEMKGRTAGYGIPDFEDLQIDYPRLHFANSIIRISYMYFQKFDLIYEIKTE